MDKGSAWRRSNKALFNKSNDKTDIFSQIKQILRNNLDGMTAYGISDQLPGRPIGTIRAAIGFLKSQGLIESLKVGEYTKYKVRA